ncbi:MAG: hypothetical protein ACXAAR_02265, partial [Candidatus Thorarchaeota archaeon]
FLPLETLPRFLDLAVLAYCICPYLPDADILMVKEKSNGTRRLQLLLRIESLQRLIERFYC